MPSSELDRSYVDRASTSTLTYDELVGASPAVTRQPLLLPALYVWSKLAPHPAASPPPAEAQRAYFKTVIRQLQLFAALDEVLDGAARHGIAITPLKGAVLAPQLYPDPGARPMADLDLLVAPFDMDATCSLLRGLGYREISAAQPRWRPDYHHHAIFCRATGSAAAAIVEVHYRLVHELGGAVDTALLLDRARPATLRGHEVLALRDIDQLYFVLLHAATHAFLDNPLWVLDARLLVDELGAKHHERGSADDELGSECDQIRAATTEIARAFRTETAIATAWRLYDQTWRHDRPMADRALGAAVPSARRWVLKLAGCPEDPVDTVRSDEADGWRYKLRSRAVRFGLTDSVTDVASSLLSKVQLTVEERLLGR